MKKSLTNGAAFVLTTIVLYSTGHWIGATVTIVLALWIQKIKEEGD